MFQKWPYSMYSILLASSFNSCIPVLSVPLTALSGLYIVLPMIEHGRLLSWFTQVMTQHQQSLEGLDRLGFEDKSLPLV